MLAFEPGSLRFDMAGSNVDQRIVSVGTTYGALTISSDVGTEGYAYFRNLDDTNYLEVGVEVAATFYPLVKLAAGQVAVFPLAVGSVYARANTAACRLQYGVAEA